MLEILFFNIFISPLQSKLKKINFCAYHCLTNIGSGCITGTLYAWSYLATKDRICRRCQGIGEGLYFLFSWFPRVFVLMRNIYKWELHKKIGILHRAMHWRVIDSILFCSPLLVIKCMQTYLFSFDLILLHCILPEKNGRRASMWFVGDITCAPIDNFQLPFSSISSIYVFFLCF